MSAVHAINLTAAWAPPTADSPGNPWRRQFGLPTGLTAADRVWLVVESPSGCRLELNGVEIQAAAAGGTLRQDVTQRLQRRNDLLLVGGDDRDPVAEAGGSVTRCPLPSHLGRVWLEIEPTA